MNGISADQGMEVVDLRFESLRDLQEDFGPFLSTEGFFLCERSDFAASEVLRFRLMLPGDFVLIEGTGVVVWGRNPEEAMPSAPSGVAVGFATLSDQGRELVERIVNSHIESGGKPFNMSRPTDNGDPQAAKSSSVEAPEESGQPDPAKFTVREDAVSGPDDQDVIVDADQRLPFAEDVEPQGHETIAAEAGESEAEPVTIDRDDGGVDEVIVAGSFEPEEIEAEQDHQAFTFEPSESPVSEPPVSSKAVEALEISLASEKDWTTEPETPQIAKDIPVSVNSPQAQRRSRLVWPLLGILVLVGAAGVIWTQFPQYLPWGEAGSPGGASDQVEQSAGQALPPEVGVTLTEEDLEAAVEAAVDAAIVPQQVVIPEPEPTEAPAPVDVVSAPGSKVVDLKAVGGENTTALLIRVDGSIESRRIRTSILPSPPRILIRISGIDSLYRPFEIPVGTSEIRGIRIGHHPETHPPSLWIVMDRVDENVVVRDVEISGNAVRVEVGR